MPFIYKMLVEANRVGKNFRGDSIPVGMGITYVPVVILSLLAIHFLFQRMNETYLTFLSVVLMMALVGITDDLMGNRDTLGFKGHIGCLIRGRLTTGGFKAVAGGIVSVLASVIISHSYIEVIINVLLIALFTNLLNLFDLRPGRAIKFYLLIGILFLILGVSSESTLILYLTIGYCVAYLPQDLKAKSMMGDVGSNTLGVSLGIVSATSFPMKYKYIIVALLIIVHLIAEKYSITAIIKNNRVLRYFDELGRS